MNFAEFLRSPFLQNQTTVADLYFGLVFTQWKVRKYYQTNIHQMTQKKLVGENAKMAGNHQSPAVICRPETLFLTKEFIIDKKYIFQ